MTVETTAQPELAGPDISGLEVGIPELAMLCERAISDLPLPLPAVQGRAFLIRESAQVLQAPLMPAPPQRSVAEIMGKLEQQVEAKDADLAETATGFLPFSVEDETPATAAELPVAAVPDDEQRAYSVSAHALEHALTIEADTHIIHDQQVALRAQAEARPPRFSLAQRPVVAVALARLVKSDPFAARVVAAATANTKAEFIRAQRRTSHTIGAVLVATRALKLL
jgi:hypothetical protein